MTEITSRTRIDRRTVLKQVGLIGATAGLPAAALPSTATDAKRPPIDQTPSSVLPTTSTELSEGVPPVGYSAEQARHYFVARPVSDTMVDIIRGLGIDYLAANPAASFRGLHESVVNYGRNIKPEFLTCLHEESAVAMAHGYSKIAGKPMAAICHGTVGLQHAAMAVYNAWCDRVPAIIIAGNHLHATERRPGIDWIHSAQDCAKLVRDFTKWDASPLTLQDFAESMVRAYKIATTPPMGPVVVVADATLQEEPSGADPVAIPRMAPTIPPIGDAGALREAGRWLAEAVHPLILADRVARTPEGMARLVALAECLQAPVIDRLGRLNFPTDHYLNQTARARQLVSEADVILGLEMNDLWGNISSVRDLVQRKEQRVAQPTAKLISLGLGDMYLKSNYQDFQRYIPADLSIAGDGEASLPLLTEEVQRAMSGTLRERVATRKRKLQADAAAIRAQADMDVKFAWDASPVSTGRLCMEIWNQIKNRDYSLVSEQFGQSHWPHRLWAMNRHHHFTGGSGGFGLGQGAPAAVGAALANRGRGRITVNIQSDGDILYAPGVLWTAAHHGIPLLSVMHNNRGYHQELMHIQTMALRRQRGVDGTCKIGNTFESPHIDFAGLAKSLGVWSAGPINDPAELAPALRRAIEVVDSGEPAFVDVVCQPR